MQQLNIVVTLGTRLISQEWLSYWTRVYFTFRKTHGDVTGHTVRRLVKYKCKYPYVCIYTYVYIHIYIYNICILSSALMHRFGAIVLCVKLHGLYNGHYRIGTFFYIKVIKMLRRLLCSIFWFHLPEIGNRILFIEVLHS